MAKCLRANVLLGGVALAAAASPAVAQDQTQKWWTTCTNNLVSDAPDQKAVACTNIISSGVLNATDLSIAFFYRGNAYFGQRDAPRAIADYSAAIRINPNSADAFNNRGRTYSAIREYARAIAELQRGDPH